MSDAYRVDADALIGAARGFSSVAGDLESAERRLGGVLDAAGACWGADEAGQQFAGKYEPGATATRRSFGAYADALRQVDAMLATMAATYTRADTGWADGFRGGAAGR